MYAEIWSQLWGKKKYIVPVLRHDLLMTPWQWRHTEENPRKKMINIEIDSETKTQWTLSLYRDHDLPLLCVL